MTEANARAMIQTWAEMEPPIRVYEPKKKPEQDKPKRNPFRTKDMNRLVKRYGILVIAAAAFTIYTIILSSCVEASTSKRVWAEAEEHYAAQLEAYKAEQAYEAQKEHWLSGDASREAFINQEIKAAAQAISKETNDQVKGTKLGVGMARMLNPNYPGTIKEVFAEEGQFMFISDENTYTQHDWDLAEKMLRPFYEDGILPNGLTQDMVFLDWNGNTATARDSYQTTTGMSTWRYQG